MKKKSMESKIEETARELEAELKGWQELREHGGMDPFWPDGTNMNLVRNHIIYGKKELLKLCGEAGIPLPAVYYEPTPPEVDKNYMAKDGQQFDIRKDRIKERHGRISTKKPADRSREQELF